MSAVKEKRNVMLNRRTFADSQQQRGLHEKHETASPNVHADSLMAMTSIEAKERLFAATRDVKGALLSAEQKNFAVLNFVSEKVSMSCDVDEKYE